MAAVVLAFLVLGIWLLRRGLRGRVIDDHPWCTACRFDLVGLAEGIRCPECGAILDLAGAVTVGRRVRRRGLVTAGALVLVTLVLLVGGYATGQFRGINWYAYKPLFLLHWDLESGDHRALAELTTRAGAGELRPADLSSTLRHMRFNVEQARPTAAMAAGYLYQFMSGTALPETEIETLVKWAFSLQADTARPFPAPVGDLVYHRFIDGNISADQFKEFMTAAWHPSLRLGHAGPVAPGEEVPVFIEWNWRGGTGPLKYEFDLPGVGWHPAAHLRTGWGGEAGSRMGLPHWLLRAPEEPGRYTARGTATLSVGTEYLDRYWPGSVGTGKRPLSSVPEVKVTVPIEVEYEVSPIAAEPTARIRNQIAAMLSTRDDAPILQLSPRAASISVFARPFAPEMELRCIVRWQYGDTKTTLGRGEFRWDSEGSSSRIVKDGGFSSNQTRNGQGTTQLNLYGPVPRGGPPTGTLILEFTDVIIGGKPAADAKPPFSVEVGPIRIQQ